MNASQYDSRQNDSTALDPSMWSRPRTVEVQGRASVREVGTSAELDQLMEEPERWDGLS